MISQTLKSAVTFCGPNVCFNANDVSAQYICAYNTMTLLYTGIYYDIMNLSGFWCSDKMLQIPEIFRPILEFVIFLPPSEVRYLHPTPIP